MAKEIDKISCKRCGKEIQGEFCSACGNAKNPRRIDGKYILSEIASTFNFDKGLLYTIRELLLRPGPSVKSFIREDRNRLVKPILFLIICSVSYSLLQQWLKFEDAYVNYSFDENSPSLALFAWVSKNYGYANILIALFVAAWIQTLFRKHDFNFFEILILLCFLIGMGMLIFSFFASLDSLSGLPTIDKGILLGVLYISWGIGTFFQGNKILNSLKGLLSYILGLLSFILILLMLGSLIERVL